MTPLTAWLNFYVIVGSSAGALIGLQFVVLSLVAGRPNVRVDPETGSAFATPTIIHFASVLLLAGILCAPWSGIGAPMILCAVVGISGVVYTAIVSRRLGRLNTYKPELEDWLFHALLPLAAYVALAVSPYAARAHAHETLFAIGAAVLLLLFAGIHNAWDAVTYHIFVSRPRREGDPHG